MRHGVRAGSVSFDPITSEGLLLGRGPTVPSSPSFAASGLARAGSWFMTGASQHLGPGAPPVLEFDLTSAPLQRPGPRPAPAGHRHDPAGHRACGRSSSATIAAGLVRPGPSLDGGFEKLPESIPNRGRSSAFSASRPTTRSCRRAVAARTFRSDEAGTTKTYGTTCYIKPHATLAVLSSY